MLRISNRYGFLSWHGINDIHLIKRLGYHFDIGRYPPLSFTRGCRLCHNSYGYDKELAIPAVGIITRTDFYETARIITIMIKRMRLEFNNG
jgi:hypothetical protein